MLDLVFAVFLVFVFTATGFFLIKRKLNPEKSYLFAFLVSFGLGYGLFGTVIFILGVQGLIRVELFFLLLSIGAFILYLERNFFRDFFVRAVFTLRNMKFCRLNSVLLSSTVALFVLNTFTSLAPISSLDSVVYHFTLPKMYLLSGKIYNMEGYFYAHLPQMTEMINLFAMALRSDISGAVLNSFFGLFCSLLIFFTVRKIFSSKLGILSSSLFYVTPLITWEATGSYPEIHLAFFSILSFYMVLLYFEEKSIFTLILSGIFLGFGFQIKHFSFNFLVIVSLLIFIYCWKNKESLFSFLKEYAVWLSTVIVAGSTWYLFNYFTTGNPFFPLLYDIFGGKVWNNEVNEVFIYYHSLVFGYGKSILSFIELPFMLTFKGTGFNGGQLGPLILAFAPFAFLDRKIFKRTSLIFLFSLVYLVIWFLSSQQTRFLIPILPFFLILVSLGIVNLEKSSSRFVNIVVKLAVILFIISSLRVIFTYSAKYAGVVLALKSREEFLENMVWDYKGTQWMNKNLPDGSKVLFSSYGQYYLNIPYVLGAYGLQGNLDFATDADHLYKILKASKISHVYCFSGYYFMPPLTLWKDLTDRYLEKIYEDKRIVEPSRSIILRGRELIGTVYRLK